MEIINSDYPFLLKNETAATIGFFDGVHAGHLYMLKQLKMHAEEYKLPSMVITFPQYPQSVLNSGIQPELLNTFNEKICHLSSAEIDYCLLLDFSQSLSQLTAKEFIQRKLKKEWNIGLLLIGHDHRFGKNREEGFFEYEKYCKECGMKIILAPELPDFAVSSTAIRNYLSEKKLKEANLMLSYNYSLEGKVIEGNRIGSKIGFPTANIELNDKNKIVPAEGVYAAWINWKSKKYRGMVYIGERPTVFVNGEKRIEVHLFDFSGDLYGKTLQIEFVEFIREDRQFGNIEELKEQLYADKEAAISALFSI